MHESSGTLRRVATDHAPAAIGPYSQAVVSDGWIFVSGQIALDPATGQVVADDVAVQVRRVLESLTAILEKAGGNLSTVVKTTIYLSDMANFSVVNEVYAEWFGTYRPARATVEVAGLPKGVDVEIDAVARTLG